MQYNLEIHSKKIQQNTLSNSNQFPRNKNEMLTIYDLQMFSNQMLTNIILIYYVIKKNKQLSVRTYFMFGPTLHILYEIIHFYHSYL